MWVTWKEVKNAEYGDLKSFRVGFCPAEDYPGMLPHEEHANSGLLHDIVARTRGYYQLTEVAPNVTHVTLLRQDDLGGSVPQFSALEHLRRCMSEISYLERKYRRNGIEVDREVHGKFADKMARPGPQVPRLSMDQVEVRSGEEQSDELRRRVYGYRRVTPCLTPCLTLRLTLCLTPFLTPPIPPLCDSLPSSQIVERCRNMQIEDHRWKKIKSPYPRVEMRLEQLENEATTLGTAMGVGILDCKAEEAAAWYFDYCSNDRNRTGESVLGRRYPVNATRFARRCRHRFLVANTVQRRRVRMGPTSATLRRRHHTERKDLCLHHQLSLPPVREGGSVQTDLDQEGRLHLRGLSRVCPCYGPGRLWCPDGKALAELF